MKNRWYKLSVMGLMAVMLCSCSKASTSVAKPENAPTEAVEVIRTEAYEEDTEVTEESSMLPETTEAMEAEMSTVKTEISEYFDDWDQFYQDYKLEKYTSSTSGMIGYKSEDGLHMGSLSQFVDNDYTFTNSGNKELQVFGIKIGDTADSIVKKWQQDHSLVVVVENDERSTIYLKYEKNKESRIIIVDFEFKEGKITAWGLCNIYEEGIPRDLACLDYLSELDINAREVHYYDEGLIFPNIQEEYLSISDIQKLSEEDLQWAINDIYALNGYKFTKEKSIAHYKNIVWYDGWVDTSERVEEDLNDYEKQNLENLKAMRNPAQATQPPQSSKNDNAFVGTWENKNAECMADNLTVIITKDKIEVTRDSRRGMYEKVSYTVNDGTLKANLPTCSVRDTTDGKIYTDTGLDDYITCSMNGSSLKCTLSSYGEILEYQLTKQ